MTPNPFQTEIPTTQPIKSFKPSPLKASALVAGLGLTLAIPAFAVNFSHFNPQDSGKSTLISQAKPKLELTLVSYAVTSAAYGKIIPAFVAKWKKEKKDFFFVSFKKFKLNLKKIYWEREREEQKLTIEDNNNKALLYNFIFFLL